MKFSKFFKLPSFSIFPNWIQWYKKPSYQDILEFSTAVRDGKRNSTLRRGSIEVPDRLGLDRILKNQTCSPMSLNDFYMYLKHIERSPENLEFYVWFKNYQTTYIEQLEGFPTYPPFAMVNHGSPYSQSRQIGSGWHESSTTNLFDHDFESAYELEQTNGILAQINTLINSPSGCPASRSARSFTILKSVAQSCGFGSRQNLRAPSPTREDIDQVIDYFLTPGGPKELNIPPAMRTTAIRGLEQSLSPDNLKPVADHCYQLLKHCSHRNFVRLGVGNGTFETICAATTFGALLVLGGTIFLIVRACYPGIGTHAHWEVLLAWPMWCIGMTLVLSGTRGSCFFMLMLSRRQYMPWELIAKKNNAKNKSAFTRFLKKLSPFDNKVRVRDLALRDLQRRIVWQSVGGGVVFACAMTVLFAFLPVWKETAFQPATVAPGATAM